ncbi:hypothetical protein [Streptomyces sp. NPDC000351]|uniref:hypothetical protein n=1 Tax=Streptomyces sp. NPDC000351 TaxID=3154250 RepID=UPI003324FB0F
MHKSNPGQNPCTTYSDHDLVVILEAAGVADPEAIWDDPQCVKWRGGPAHECSAASEFMPHPPGRSAARLITSRDSYSLE